MRGKCLGMLLGLLLLGVGLSIPDARGGSIVEKDGKTIITVKVQQLPDPSQDDTKSRADVEVVRKFKKEFPKIFAKKYAAKYKANPEKYGKFNWDNVEIVLERFAGIQVEGVENDLLAIAGGMAPDLLYINFLKSDNYIRNGFLYPLDKYFAQLTPKQIAEKVHPKIMPVCRRKGPDGKEHYWTMPFDGILGKVLIYRKDLFEKNDVPFPDKTWTWKDLLAACKKLTDPAKGIYGIRLGQGKHESWFWITFLWSAGGDVMLYNKDKDTWKCTFDTDAAVKALDFYTRLGAEKWTQKVDGKEKIRRGYSYKSPSQSGTKWERGQIGMMFDYIDEKLLSKIDPNNFGMAPVPIGPSGKRGGELNSRMFGMFAEIKSEVVRDAAWEYILYYDSIPAQKIRTKVMVEGGYGKFVNKKYLKMFGYDEFIKLTPKGWNEALEMALDYGQPEPYGQNSNFAYKEMTKPIQLADQMEMADELAPVGTQKRYEQLKKILKDGCVNANKIMIGKLSKQEKLNRRIQACFVLLAIAVAFFLVFSVFLHLLEMMVKVDRITGSSVNIDGLTCC
ncbi:MAG: extracellular solute-binding protein [Lentisphaerae bacterium]|nr:extracellular solute-binding protein [Lentisphaerota bacterium]MCP4101740.1 extracellular solute-binding protein [Lentisphaerota bacterium]